MPIILIPVRNRRGLVGAAVRSALDQGVEVSVLDNASDDGTWQALNEAFAGRVTLHRHPVNIGLFGNLDACRTRAGVRPFKILCSDDRLLPGAMQREQAAMAASGAAIVVSRGAYVDERGRRRGDLADELRPGTHHDAARLVLEHFLATGVNPLNYPSGILVGPGMSERCGPFLKDFRVAGDVEWYLRALRHGPLVVLAQHGVEILRHPGQLSDQAKRRDSLIEIREMVRLCRLHGDLLARGRLSGSRRCAAALAALSGWLMARHLLRRNPAGALRHWHLLACVRLPMGLKAAACLYLVVQRTWRATRRSVLRMCPCRT